MSTSNNTMPFYANYFIDFIKKEESFSPFPIWDNKQWSWGFGTAAGYNKNIKPSGTITKDKAAKDSLIIANNHYNTLKVLIKKDLTPEQWAALLSFSYNLGIGNAKNLVTNINSGNTTALFSQMRKYVISDGVKLDGLVARREKEIDLFKIGMGADTAKTNSSVLLYAMLGVAFIAMGYFLIKS